MVPCPGQAQCQTRGVKCLRQNGKCILGERAPTLTGQAGGQAQGACLTELWMEQGKALGGHPLSPTGLVRTTFDWHLFVHRPLLRPHSGRVCVARGPFRMRFPLERCD